MADPDPENPQDELEVTSSARPLQPEPPKNPLAEAMAQTASDVFGVKGSEEALETVAGGNVVKLTEGLSDKRLDQVEPPVFHRVVDAGPAEVGSETPTSPVVETSPGVQQAADQVFGIGEEPASAETSNAAPEASAPVSAEPIVAPEEEASAEGAVAEEAPAEPAGPEGTRTAEQQLGELQEAMENFHSGDAELRSRLEEIAIQQDISTEGKTDGQIINEIFAKLGFKIPPPTEAVAVGENENRPPTERPAWLPPDAWPGLDGNWYKDGVKLEDPSGRPAWLPPDAWLGPDGWYVDGKRIEAPAEPETPEETIARLEEETRQLREQLGQPRQTQAPAAERAQEEDPFALTPDNYSRKDLDGRISYVEKVVGAKREGDDEMDNDLAHATLDDLENMDLTDPNKVRQVARAADFLARRGGLNLHYIEGLQLQCPEVAGAMMKRLEGLTKFKKLLERHNMKGFSFYELWRNTLKMSPAAAKWILIAALTLGGGVALAGLGPGYAKMLGGIATR